MAVALEAENLTLIRGGRLLFRDLSFRVPAGAVWSLEGPNGAGKTSLLRLLAGFLRPAAGTVRVRIQAAAISDAEERMGLVGWLGHEDAVKPQLSVREQLRFFARLFGSPAAPDAAMAAFGLEKLADVPGQFLSAGQKRRLALARLKLVNRPLWLLDEPLAALDAAGRTLASQAMAEHGAAGGIAIAATHEPLGLPCETLKLGDVWP